MHRLEVRRSLFDRAARPVIETQEISDSSRGGPAAQHGWLMATR